MSFMKAKRDRLLTYLDNLKSYPTNAKAAAVVIDAPVCVLPAMLLNTKYLAYGGAIYNESGMITELLHRRQKDAMNAVSVGEITEAAAHGYIFEAAKGRMSNVTHGDEITGEAGLWAETAS